ncbi:MAG: hypothetical protein ABS79_05085 [Planctomycetes bacterium SCN 63-9]|nr:MAG: hypothetical protein ABS79_05085 [Planctomycetes bacterium SCN 63-9]
MVVGPASTRSPEIVRGFRAPLRAEIAKKIGEFEKNLRGPWSCASPMIGRRHSRNPIAWARRGGRGRLEKKRDEIAINSIL